MLVVITLISTADTTYSLLKNFYIGDVEVGVALYHKIETKILNL